MNLKKKKINKEQNKLKAIEIIQRIAPLNILQINIEIL